MGTNKIILHKETSPIKALNPTIEIIIMVEIVRLRTKEYRSMNSCITFCASWPLHASVCMCMQYFESHHEFILVVTIREFFRYLVDISCGDGMS